MTDLLEASPISIQKHPELANVSAGSRLTSTSFPPGARLLRVETAKGVDGDEATGDTLLIVCVPRDPIGSCEQHPANADVLQGAEIVGAIMQQVVGGGLEMRTERISFAKRINELCVQQSEDEMKLHGELPKQLRRVPKKIL